MSEAPRVAILVVEDEALIRSLVQEALEQSGYAVELVSNGADAIARIESETDTIKGLVSDIRLGAGPSGWDVARRARELIHDLPVVYMTGDSAGEWNSLGVPNSVLVVKPFAVDQVVTAVSSLLTDAAAKAAT